MSRFQKQVGRSVNQMQANQYPFKCAVKRRLPDEFKNLIWTVVNSNAPPRLQ
ncbi:hypothetical protein Cflav_PD0504 [Pedosphaera parvula Ellin514]|uniref:Uncharacterized protein n=1 Tax=Pedosphaera parvula (strain Ellin514) TaxID=320771 RepID=B9XRQ5_PEDPL|nr:hypothetical protein Cflav_PD0504 [Pedosphaera parvula Ellin514]